MLTDLLLELLGLILPSRTKHENYPVVRAIRLVLGLIMIVLIILAVIFGVQFWFHLHGG